MAKVSLNPEVAEKYKLVGISPQKRTFAELGTIDFQKISLEDADTLYRLGFKYLKLKETPKVKSKDK